MHDARRSTVHFSCGARSLQNIGVGTGTCCFWSSFPIMLCFSLQVLTSASSSQFSLPPLLSFSRRHSPLVLPSHHGSHFFFRFLEIDSKQCVAIETELKNIVVQYFLKPVWRKMMESPTLSVCLFYLRVWYDSLIPCISQMSRWCVDTLIVFNKKRTQEWPGWRCDCCGFLSGKQQERQATGNLWILPSWEQQGQARHCAEECYGLEQHHMQHCPNPALPSFPKYNCTRDWEMHGNSYIN